MIYYFIMYSNLLNVNYTFFNTVIWVVLSNIIHRSIIISKYNNYLIVCISKSVGHRPLGGGQDEALIHLLEK